MLPELFTEYHFDGAIINRKYIDLFAPCNIGKKVKPLRAKPIKSIINDPLIENAILINTLEGEQKIMENSMVCVGELGDVWQQKKEKLIQKYNIVNVDENDWLICEPKPENNVYCFQLTEDLLLDNEIRHSVSYRGFKDPTSFLVIGQWGKERWIDEGRTKVYVQEGKLNDWICQNPTDPDDIWIVQKRIFDSTYEATPVKFNDENTLLKDAILTLDAWENLKK